MGFRRRIWKYVLLFVMTVSLIVTGLAGCQNTTSVNQVQVTDKPIVFPHVDSLPTPELPDWIESISPKGATESLAQIRVLFKHPLIPVERIDTPQQKEILKKFQVIPPIPGQFRFLTPKMIGFQADQPLPKATRFQVTMQAGLADLEAHELTQDVKWTFETEQIKLSGLPGTPNQLDDSSAPLDLQVESRLTSNIPLDLDIAGDRLLFVNDDDESQVVASTLNLETSDEVTQGQFQPDQEQWHYLVKPKKSLNKASHYRFEAQPGLRPLQGNLPLDKAITSHFQTYEPLRYERMEFYGEPGAGKAFGRFEQGSPYLYFNNGINADSAIANISISPKPVKDDDLFLRAYNGSHSVEINPWVLEPATEYTVALGKNLEDEFGQTLGTAKEIKFNTGNVAGDIWAQQSFHIFPAGTDLSLDVETINLPDQSFDIGYRTVQPTDLVYAENPYPAGNSTDLAPAKSTWKSQPVEQTKNTLIKTPIPIREKLGKDTGMLAYGVKAKANQYLQDGKQQWRSPEFYGMVQLTNLGVFAQWFPESGIVRVHHLDTGKAVANAEIQIYQSKLESKTRGNPSACATGKTDADGNLILSGGEWQRCLRGQEYGPKLLVVAKENTDWAFVRTHEYSGGYGYGVYASWDTGETQSRGTIFSDRQLYQPGEKAYFTGVAYYLKNGKLRRDINQSYKVIVSDPEGKETTLDTYQTNKFGTFSVEWDVPENQDLGSYYLRAEASNGNSIYGNFRVAEFRPPNFKVDLGLSKKFVQMGDRLTAKTTGTYLFGAPVSNSKVNYFVTRMRGFYRPDAWDEFTFGRQWHWSESEPSIGSDVLQTEKKLDDAGQGSQEIQVDNDLPYPVTYRVEASVTDAANLSVSNTQVFTALPSDRLIGLSHDFVAAAEKPFNTRLLVTDPEGQPISGQTVKVELQKVNYSRVTQIIEGSRVNRPQVDYETVDTETVKSTLEPITFDLTSPDSGSYRIHALIKGQEEAAATDSFIWVSGGDWFSWGDRFDNNRIEVTLDKKNYGIGDTATALIQSPYQKAELYFSVIRHGVIYETKQTVSGAAPTVNFTVTSDMMPNAAVEAVLVRQGESLEEARKNGVDKLMKIGFTDFKTDLKTKELTVDVKPQQEKITPGAEQTLQLELKDQQGQAVAGQVTVMVVNDAILQLNGYRPPNLLDEVYRYQPITTRWADNRPNVSIAPLDKSEQKGWGYGGGASSALANTRTRTDFRAIAYYNGSVLTNAQGLAEVKFTLPDDLTTWRVLAVATDEQTRFGNAEADFIATQPLLTNPVLPQFARVGDRLEGGVLVTNTTGSKGKVQIQAEVNGAMEFAKGRKQRQTLKEDIGNNSEAFRISVVATKAGTATFKFTTQKGRDADAFEVPLEVKQLSVREQAITTGILTEDKAIIPLKIDGDMVRDQGGLTLTLASTLIPELTAPARQTFYNDDFPFLEPTASRLTIAANIAILKERYGQTFENFDIKTEAKQALEDLAQLQLPSGGFASFPGDETPDPYVNPYAAEAIALAEQAKLSVPADMVNRLQTYLDQTLANPTQFSVCESTSCKDTVRLGNLVALDQFKNVRGDFASDLYDAREEFDTVGKIKLARHLAKLPDWQTQAQAIATDVGELIYQTGRTAQINLPQRWYWYHSNTTAQAQALQLFVELSETPETVSQVLQGLLDQRRDGTWQTSYDNAQALTALTRYSNTESTPPNLDSTVKLDRKKLADFEFWGYTQPSATLNVPMEDLPKGDRQLIIKKEGDGKLHYLSEFEYRLTGNQPGKLNGMRITRNIRLANKTEVIRKYGLYDLKEPFTVGAGEVFDIGLEIITDHPVDHVLISDPLPAGFEAINTDFQTATTYYQPQQDSWQLDYQKIYKDKVIAYGDRLDAGVYNLHYLVRAVTPGNFDYPGAEVSLQYNPETFGRSTSSQLQVK
ncbi:alpha-2-macroglobulin domain protein [[Leptolyngbya] sp. PCC 7376]|uniref:alpha-2-macroglobulin family protein n=1 Tax=[Leptolyngbya] sp. PCC 7376 TaxID=111781 RepID=UPI00029ED679|nr:alpha-2-macroglobulin family protein [[Leptolyngbya] sp. PCC 7376]AFY36746.1 alpha-2-macroglobulin domain protein [[Leptolyngbya] sp. PCC 7376]